MTKLSAKQVIWDYIQIFIGVSILAASVVFFFAPYDMVIGGVSGLALIIRYYTGLEVSLITLIANLILLPFAIKIGGLKLLPRTIFGFMTLPFAIWLLGFVPQAAHDFLDMDLFLAAIFGGIICGVGVGIVFRKNATTGGSTLIADLIRRVIKRFTTPSILMVVDGLIVTLGFFVFGPMATLYAMVSVFVSFKAAEFVMDWGRAAKAVMIISNNSEEIGKALTEKMERGVTSLEGHGVYTGNKKNVLLCVVAKNEIVRLKEIVSEMDKSAFVIVKEVREVLGEGFAKE